MRAFEKLPPKFQNDEVKYYYDIIAKKSFSLVLKRITDIIFSLIILVILIIPIAVIAVIVKATSKGPVFTGRRELLLMAGYLRFLNFVLWCKMPTVSAHL